MDGQNSYISIAIKTRMVGLPEILKKVSGYIYWAKIQMQHIELVSAVVTPLANICKRHCLLREMIV